MFVLTNTKRIIELPTLILFFWILLSEIKFRPIQTEEFQYFIFLVVGLGCISAMQLLNLFVLNNLYTRHYIDVFFVLFSVANIVYLWSWKQKRMKKLWLVYKVLCLFLSLFYIVEWILLTKITSSKQRTK